MKCEFKDCDNEGTRNTGGHIYVCAGHSEYLNVKEIVEEHLERADVEIMKDCEYADADPPQVMRLDELIEEYASIMTDILQQNMSECTDCGEPATANHKCINSKI